MEPLTKKNGCKCLYGSQFVKSVDLTLFLDPTSLHLPRLVDGRQETTWLLEKISCLKFGKVNVPADIDYCSNNTIDE